jgi:transcriptional regulator with XRE-family HTH domain
VIADADFEIGGAVISPRTSRHHAPWPANGQVNPPPAEARELLLGGDAMSPQEAFVTRLRRHRQRNRISLEEIAAETRVKREMFEALEANDLSSWPRGLYARAWVRTYACAVGLDPIDTVDEFCRLFPQGDRRGHVTMQDIASIVATKGEFRDEFPNGERRGSPTGAPVQPRTPSWQNTVLDAARHAGDAVVGLARHVKTRRAGVKPT